MLLFSLLAESWRRNVDEAWTNWRHYGLGGRQADSLVSRLFKRF
jgi:hypothetical protein